jgi:hypothetical protein
LVTLSAASQDSRRHHDLAMSAVVQERAHLERMQYKRSLIGFTSLTSMKLLRV